MISPLQRLLPAAIAAIAISSLLAPALRAQRYQLRDGRVIEAEGTIVRGSQIVRPIAGYEAGTAEIAYPISQVARLDFPEPSELPAAREALAAGHPADALANADTIAAQFAPFNTLPGSWWADATLLRAQALLDLNRTDEASSAARSLLQAEASAELKILAKVVIARAELASGKATVAAALLDDVLKDKPPAAVEPQVLLLRGDIALQRGSPEDALDSYLQIPAFFGTREDLMPRVLLGSIRAYRAYGDGARAERAYLELLSNYSESPEATVARRENPEKP